jgi:hypothetical protein
MLDNVRDDLSEIVDCQWWVSTYLYVSTGLVNSCLLNVCVLMTFCGERHFKLKDEVCN